MHEYSLVQAMFDQIESTARANHAAAVTRVRVKIGEAAGVEVGLFRVAYDLFRIRTICEDAPLEVDVVPVAWVCPGGHGRLEPGRPLICAVCGRPARMAAGDELVLEQVELEVR